MDIHDYDYVKIKDGRVGLVYAVSQEYQSAMVVLRGTDKKPLAEYPAVDDGFFDGAVDIPFGDIVAVSRTAMPD